MLVLNITSKCNFRCITCIRGYPESVHNISIELIDKVLIAVSKLKIREIGITGGEPCLHPEFEKIVGMIIEKGYSLSFVSNGSINKEYEFLIEKYRDHLRGMTFSLDGATEEVHDKIRQKGSFRKVCESIRFFASRGVKTYASMCINKINMHQIEPVIGLAKDLGVQNVSFVGVIRTPENEHILISDEEKKMCQEEILRMRKKYDMPLKITSSLGAQEGVDFCSGINLSGIEVNPRGEISFCCDMLGYGAVVGSLKHKSFAELCSKCLDLSCQLKKKRVEMLNAGKTGEGFNTCEFCNTFLEKYIKKT